MRAWIMQTQVLATSFKEVLYLRFNEHHLSACSRMLMTQLQS